VLTHGSVTVLASCGCRPWAPDRSPRSARGLGRGARPPRHGPDPDGRHVADQASAGAGPGGAGAALGRPVCPRGHQRRLWRPPDLPAGPRPPAARLRRGRAPPLRSAPARRGACGRPPAPVAPAGAWPAAAAPRALRPRPCWRPCRRPAGSPSPGARPTTGACAHRAGPCGHPGRRVARRAPPARIGAPPGQRASGAARVRCQAHAARSRGRPGPCRRTRRGTGGSRGPTAAGPASRALRRPQAPAVWTTTRAGAGRACIGPSPWACGPRAVWRASAGGPPPWRAFPLGSGHLCVRPPPRGLMRARTWLERQPWATRGAPTDGPARHSTRRQGPRRAVGRTRSHAAGRSRSRASAAAGPRGLGSSAGPGASGDAPSCRRPHAAG